VARILLLRATIVATTDFEETEILLVVVLPAQAAVYEVSI